MYNRYHIFKQFMYKVDSGCYLFEGRGFECLFFVRCWSNCLSGVYMCLTLTSHQQIRPLEMGSWFEVLSDRLEKLGSHLTGVVIGLVFLFSILCPFWSLRTRGS